MSKIYSVEVILEASHDLFNIALLLEKGASLGFVYHDHVDGKMYNLAPVLSAKDAAQKIINYDFIKDEAAPSVYTIYEDDGFFLWCFQSEDQFLKVSIGGFGNPKEKDGSLDFAHYIRLLLDLCDDFVILSLTTEIIP